MYVNDTGEPSVTEIIGQYIDKQYFTDESRDRGSAVHAACEAHMKGLWVLPLRPEWQLYFDSFRRWMDIVKIEPVLVEKRLADHSLGYCGQMDLIGKISGVVNEYDWKTSAAHYPWWRIQGVAYKQLAINIEGLPVNKCYSVRLKRDGTGCVVNEIVDHEYHWNIFVGLLNAHNFFNKRK